MAVLEERGLLRKKAQDSELHKLVSSAQLAASYIRASLARNRRGFCVGVSTIALVVTFSALLMSAISSAPLIFMKLAEDQAGESDIVLTAEVTPESGMPTLNYTALNRLTAGNAAIKGVAPRWPLVAVAANHGDPSQSLLSYILGMDSEREAAIGLGRGWGRRPLGEQECYASATLLREIGLQGSHGDLLDVRFDVVEIMNTLSAVSGGGSAAGGSGNATSSAQQRQALVTAILAAAGVDVSHVTITIDGAAALEAALRANGLLAPGQAFNATQFREQFPGLAEVTLDLTPLLSQALANAAAALSITGTYTIVEEFDSNKGKFASLLGNAVVLEARHLPSLIRRAIVGAIQQVQNVLQPLATLAGTPSGTGAAATAATGATASISAGAAAMMAALQRAQDAVPGIDYPLMQQYALEVDGMAANRLAMYFQGSADAIDASVTAFADAVMADSLGTDAPVNVATPLADTLGGLQFIALFLNQIFIVVAVVLAILGGVVIFALVLGDVETRTFEMGMLRALGMKHTTLAQLLAIQTAAFGLPGVALGLVISSLLNLGIAAIVRWYAALSPGDWPDAMFPLAWGYATSIGLVVPTLAVIVPIRRAFTGVLRDALDLSHQVVSEMTVRILRLKDVGLSPGQTALAIMLTVVGFITFYALPLSFLFRDFAAFLGLLTAILLGMLVGLAILAQTVQPYAELLILRLLLLCGRDERRLGTVVRKNLDGHRPRNSKTSMLISLTIGFLVFAAAMFQLQARSIVSNVRMFLGGDIAALVLTTAGGGSNAVTDGTGGNATVSLALPQQDMSAFLDGVKARGGPVEGYTFVSLPLTSLPIVRRTPLSNLVNIPWTRNVLYGVQSNYLDVAYAEYALVTESSAQGIQSDSAGVAETAGGSVRKFVGSQPVRALYSGTGSLTLPLESSLPGPPAALSAAPGGAFPGFVCDAAGVAAFGPGTGAVGSAEADAAAAREAAWIQRIPIDYIGNPSQFAAVTYDGMLHYFAPGAAGSTSVDANGNPLADPTPAATVTRSLPDSIQAPSLPAQQSASAGSLASFGRAIEYVRNTCGYDGSNCNGRQSWGPGANVSSTAGAATIGQLLFTDLEYCEAACNDALVFNYRQRVNGSATTQPSWYSSWAFSGDWLWAPPAPGSFGEACAYPNTAAGAAAYAAAAGNWSGGGFGYDLPATTSAAGLRSNAQLSATSSGNAAKYNGLWVGPPLSAAGGSGLPRALVNATVCSLPRACVAVARVSPFDASDRITGAYLRYIDVLMSESMRSGASVSTATPLSLRLITRDPKSNLATTRTYLAKARGMLQKFPGFLFSSYPQTASRSPVIIRMVEASRLVGDALADYAWIVDYTRQQSVAGASTAAVPASSTAAVAQGGTTIGAAAGNGSATVTIRRSFPPVPLWFPSSAAWLQAVFPPLPSTAPAGGRPSAAFDGDASSSWAVALPTLAAAGASPVGAALGTVGPASKLLGTPALPPHAEDALYPSITALSADAGTSVTAAEAVCPSYDTGDVSDDATTARGGGLAPAGCTLATAQPRLAAAQQQAVARAMAGQRQRLSANDTLMMTLDLGACGLVSGLRLSTNATALTSALALAAAAATGAASPAVAAPPLIAVSLYALSDVSAQGYERVATVVTPVQLQSQAPSSVGGGSSQQASIASTAQLSATFSAYSSRYWAVTVTVLNSAQATTGLALALPDITLAVGRVSPVAGACTGTGLGVSDAVPSLPKHRLLVRMKPGSTDLERQRVINSLRSSVRSPLIQIQDTQALVSATDVAVLGLDLFFNFVAALALILAFFSTWLSFASNVRENSVEFGILRSLGLPAVAVIRSYCYEALTVVLTSFSLGTVVGLLVAITLTLQFNLFTEMPFSFVFPTSLFVFTLLGCIALALAASYYPARAIARMQVAGVLKGRAA